MGEVRTYGYARVSTDDQDLRLQRDALIRHGVNPDWIIEEHASGGTMKRKELARLFRVLRPGDTLVVWKLDRLGRTLKGVLEVLERIETQGIKFVSLTEMFDTSTAMGKAMLHLCMVFAELERGMISERTKAGMAAARAAGKRFGRSHLIKDYPKRLRYLKGLDRAGKLRDEAGELLISARELTERLNARRDTDEAPEIKNAETLRRWKREGFEGLAGADEELALGEEEQ